jgi:beta-galactosidase
MIDDNGWVYLNGEFVGESHDWSLDPRFEVRKFLHAGTNTLAVVVKNDDGQGGLNKGVTLEFEDEQTSANWQRSVFNGLAQVIVQSDGTPGEIKLSATGRGLNQATAIIQTETQSVGEQP